MFVAVAPSMFAHERAGVAAALPGVRDRRWAAWPRCRCVAVSVSPAFAVPETVGGSRSPGRPAPVALALNAAAPTARAAASTSATAALTTSCFHRRTSGARNGWSRTPLRRDANRPSPSGQGSVRVVPTAPRVAQPQATATQPGDQADADVRRPRRAPAPPRRAARSRTSRSRTWCTSRARPVPSTNAVSPPNPRPNIQPSASEPLRLTTSVPYGERRRVTQRGTTRARRSAPGAPIAEAAATACDEQDRSHQPALRRASCAREARPRRAPATSVAPA